MNKSRLVYGLGLVALSLAVFFLATKVEGRWSRHSRSSKWDKSKVASADSFGIVGVSKLKTSSVCDIVIIPSDEEKVVFVYDKEEMKNLSEVKDNTLYIELNSKDDDFFHFGGTASALVKVYTHSVNTIVQDGVGSIKGEGLLVQDNWTLQNEGVGSMRLELQAHHIDVRNEGVGSITLKGSADDAEIDNAGTGSILAHDLLLKTAKVQNEGVGSVKVNASESLDMDNEGVGSIYYSGTAKVLRSQSEGVGSIKKN